MSTVSDKTRILLQGGTVVTEDVERPADVLIEDGKILEVRTRKPGVAAVDP